MENIIKEGRTRRDFLKGAGAVMAGGVVVGVVGSQLSCGDAQIAAPDWWTSDSDPLSLAPNAEAYLVMDSMKCASCSACMAACSLVNEGEANYALARTQVISDPIGRFPTDVKHQICRQCVYPTCIEVCPSGAFHVDADNGNTRTVNEGVCADYQASIAPDVCQLCVEACPYVPSMAIWNHKKGVAMVCDLCKSAPYWSKEGGANGKQACVEACPATSIQLVHEVPSQKDNEGYNRNLRTEHYATFSTNLDKLPTIRTRA
ncbi:MAG: twin-arginine translocation signal domain-containing protein [Dehalococcoidales bacterium]|jgi:protein NrfC|nr:twin-arginine translocation signal domain-containing protein [Dehalococcoidales bacterium]|tara:strand:- start:374 stop:1153 length:780 start_codon:yes stop_codon:yes gene_type:complete